jgi:hypothetical protein
MKIIVHQNIKETDENIRLNWRYSRDKSAFIHNTIFGRCLLGGG